MWFFERERFFKVSSGGLTTRLALFHRLRSEMLGSMRVASDAANSGYFNVFVYGCGAAAVASAFAYLLALDVGISTAAANSFQFPLVFECAILSLGTFGFRN